MMAVGLGMSFQSCDDSKTYAELKEEEREAIKRYIELNNIKGKILQPVCQIMNMCFLRSLESICRL